MANDIEKRNQVFLIYQDENGIARVNVRFEGEDVWLNVEQSDHESLSFLKTIRGLSPVIF